MPMLGFNCPPVARGRSRGLAPGQRAVCASCASGGGGRFRKLRLDCAHHLFGVQPQPRLSFRQGIDGLGRYAVRIER